MADISKIKPNGADGTEYDVKDATARSAIAGKANNTQTFTEASIRANIASGENMATLFGKIKKFFSDLKTVAFTGAYSDLSGQPTKVSQFTNDSGYTTNTGTVTQVKVGNAAYNPSSGVVSLPAYPTSVNYATSAGSAGTATSAGTAAKGTNNKFETTFLTLGSNGNEPSVTVHNSVSGDGTLKVGFNPNDTAMGSSGRNLYLPIGSMYSSGQATLATVEYLNSNLYRQISAADVYNTAEGFGRLNIEPSRVIGAIVSNWGSIIVVPTRSSSSSATIIYFYTVSSSGTLVKAVDTRITARVYYI